MLPTETMLRFRNAFPSAIHRDVEMALTCMPVSEWPPSLNDIGPVEINEEQLRIPFRFYSNDPDSSCLPRLNERQRLILNAIYTRHSSGYIRERCVKPLLFSDELWIPPFVIQLLGEYVLEIIQVLAEHLAVFTGSTYLRFARENGAFFQLVRQRIASYWNCYYRFTFPRLKEYPAFRILELIEASI